MSVFTASLFVVYGIDTITGNNSGCSVKDCFYSSTLSLFQTFSVLLLSATFRNLEIVSIPK